MRIEGTCLCGGIRFALRGPLPGIVQCHCSLCRRASGTAAIATIGVPADQFDWISGEDLITIYERPSGYGTAFCRICGSPAPDVNRGRTRYGIPVGLLADSADLSVIEHIWVGSKASWEVIGGDAVCFEEDKPRP